MTTSQWWVNVAVISPTLNQPPHPQILQQKLVPVTSDFLSPTSFFCLAEARLLVEGSTVITSSRTSSIIAEKKSKWLINCDFSHFMSLILPCGRDKSKCLFIFPGQICTAC